MFPTQVAPPPTLVPTTRFLTPSIHLDPELIQLDTTELQVESGDCHMIVRLDHMTLPDRGGRGSIVT